MASVNDVLWERLKTMKVGGSREVGTLSHTELMAWYRAAKKHGIKVSIKANPNGMTVWRIR